jgi:uncharacterized protein (UPF0276 family)
MYVMELGDQKLGFGLGMDLQWDSPHGFMPHNGQFVLSPGVKSYLQKSAADYSYFFFSFQPKDFDLLTNPRRIVDYFAPYDRVVESLPEFRGKFALHHTMLNLGSMEAYPRDAIIAFTNVLIERYGLMWVNEDLGIWNLKGKALPYPMPPILTTQGLKASIQNVAYYQERLKAPLFVEFPGFSEGGNFSLGSMDAFDFYRKVIEETDAHAVLDTGHILSYQWMKGRTGDRCLEGLDRELPLANCSEVHLSGCSIVGDRLVDYHHGVLLEEQLTLLDFLLANAPNLRAVTYEDPKFSADGVIPAKALGRYERLRDKVRAWSA